MANSVHLSTDPVVPGEQGRGGLHHEIAVLTLQRQILTGTFGQGFIRGTVWLGLMTLACLFAYYVL